VRLRLTTRRRLGEGDARPEEAERERPRARTGDLDQRRLGVFRFGGGERDRWRRRGGLIERDTERLATGLRDRDREREREREDAGESDLVGDRRRLSSRRAPGPRRMGEFPRGT